MTQTSPWSDEDVETVSRLWKEGRSGTEISVALGGKFSRSSVIGKMHKLGLQRDPAKRKIKTRTRESVQDRIRKRFLEKGQVPSEIANRVNVSTQVVIQTLTDMGLDPTANDSESYRIHPMWNMEEDERREAFKAKFAAGWRKVVSSLRRDRENAGK